MKKIISNLIINGWILIVTSPLFAMAQRPQNPDAPPPPAWVQFFPFIVMIVVFYFLLIRPQMRQKKEKAQLMSNLKRGDRVVTTGGLIGTIVNVNDTIFDLKLNEETKVKVLKTAVLDVFHDTSDSPQPPALVGSK